MVGEAVLGEVIGLNFFGAHTTANGGGTAGVNLSEALLFLMFPKFGPKDFEGDFFVSGLEAFLADGDNDSGGFVGQSDGGVDLVDVLAPRATGGGELPVKVGFFDFDGFGGYDGENRDGGGASVDSAGGFGLGDALDAMNSTFDGKSFISAVTPRIVVANVDADNILVDLVEFEALGTGKASVHSGQIVGEVLGFVATGGGADFDGGWRIFDPL